MISRYTINEKKNGLFYFELKDAEDNTFFTSEDYSDRTDIEQAIDVLFEQKKKLTTQVKTNSYNQSYISIYSPDGYWIYSTPYDDRTSAEIALRNIERRTKQQDIIRKVIKETFDESQKEREQRDLYQARIDSVAALISKVSLLERESESSYYFRGHSDYKYDLVPGVYRDSAGWKFHEHKLFREIMMKCPNDFSGATTTFQKLVKMQHYSLPTRLLDITSNALVALYFSCLEKQDECDGAIKVLKIPNSDIRYFDDEEVSMLANVSKQEPSFKLSDPEGDDRYNLKRLQHAILQDGCFSDYAINEKALNKVVCVMPEMSNPRIIRQDGAFLIFGMDQDKLTPPRVPKEYLEVDEEINFTVLGKAKAKILKELDALGLSVASVYPEIEHVAGYIRTKYQ